MAGIDALPMLRFITCGSVDDGKSTLIGRLLHDAGALTSEQQAALGAQGNQADYAQLLDGLEDEQAQGITIDVAYRHFSSATRRYLVADCPGHEQYTRNMATGASTADLAVVLIDARKGMLPQTRRHARIVAMFGVRQVIFVINKMDAIGWSQQAYRALQADCASLSAHLGFERSVAIPVSALHGDHVVSPSLNMPWCDGPTLMQALEGATPAEPPKRRTLCLPVQWIQRPHQDFRGVCGTVASGTAIAGMEVLVQPSNLRNRIATVHAPAGGATSAGPGEAATIALADHMDVARGDVVAAADHPLQVSDQFSVQMLWMHEEALLPGRPYRFQCGTADVMATVTELKHRVDIGSGQQLATRRLAMNEIGACELHLERAIAFAPFAELPALGSFILVDRHTLATVAAGTIDFALRRASNLHWHEGTVDRAARMRIKGHAPCCIWLTGLSGAGKSTIADRLEARLNARGVHTFLLDGDNLRHGLNSDLGFRPEDRVENIRRAAEVAKLMVDAGLVVLCSFISPYRAERRLARELFAEGEFVEVHVDVPLAEAEARDPKGLYAKARAGQIPNFTGIDAPYEPPESAELVLHTDRLTVDEAVASVLQLLEPQLRA